MAQVFDKPDQDALFKQWMRENPAGFYLNQGERAGEVILHQVGCWHLGDGEGVISTTYAKIADASREALLGEARGRKLSVRVCGTCKPDEAA